ncbi:MAG: hypothetical protein R3B72_13785 [Polyangiaceae bacterium]
MGERRGEIGVGAALVILSAGCSSEGPAGTPREPTSLRDDLAAAADDFYAAPFPSDHRRHPDGTVDLGAFPNPEGLAFVADMLGLLDGRAEGFSTTSGVFFSATAALDPDGLPGLAESVAPDAPAFLIDIEPDSPDYLALHPVTVGMEEDGGPFGAPHLLSLLPLQGLPLRPSHRYAAVVTRDLRDAAGERLGPATRHDEGPGAASEARAWDALAEAGIPAEEVAGLAAFTTDDGTAPLRLLADHARGLTTPAPTEPWVLTDELPGYCVYQTVVEMPVYQSGEPPYTEGGGEILFEDGVPQLDHLEPARLVITVPRVPSDPAGAPTAVMVRTGGGGDRPLVDRGIRDAQGMVAVPGEGPAKHFAEAGWAGVTVDGPHGGIRNVTGGDEQFLIFNIQSPVAMRDNIRQSALELALLPDVLADLTLDTSGCSGASPVTRFDTQRLALMGHSMGATISPLTLAVEPRYAALILSGAGGSWIENVVYKRSPVPVRPFAELILHYATSGRQLHEHDPALSLFQWSGEGADPPPYARGMVRAGDERHVLMLQGIVDTYILPPIANATSLAFGLDLGGSPLDAEDPKLSGFTPALEVLPYVGRGALALPSGPNRDGAVRIVVQHPEDGVEDGHEVMFQTEPPKHQYQCFLASLLAGSPEVPAGAPLATACP